MFLVDIGAFQREIDEAGGDAVLPDRNLPHHQRCSGGRLHGFQEAANAALEFVDLVDEQHVGNAAVFKLPQDHLQRRELLVVGFRHRDNEIDTGQYTAGFTEEFDRSGTVDEGVAIFEIVGAGDIGLDVHHVDAGFRRGVADGVALGDAALPVDGPGARQHCFQKGRLAASERPHQCDAPGPRFSAVCGCSVSQDYLPACYATRPFSGLRPSMGRHCPAVVK